MVAEINWIFLTEALSYYAEKGYKYIEVDWTAPKEIMQVTCPSDDFLVDSTVGQLVGSAEQSFLHLDHMGKLASGAYMTLTPCFRNEPVIDEFHQKTFMKLELYVNNGESHADHVKNDALSFMKQLIHRYAPKARVSSYQSFGEIGTDIVTNIDGSDVELGSYGKRYSILPNMPKPMVEWIYGTGLAEPRFSTALKKVSLQYAGD